MPASSSKKDEKDQKKDIKARQPGENNKTEETIKEKDKHDQDKSRGRRGRGKGKIRILFGNVTKWGKKTAQFCGTCGFDAVLAVETHLKSK